MKRVLLIDDDQISNLINERVVKKSGVAEQVVVCNSAKSGLEFLSSLQGQQAAGPEVILLDINMPVMDGFGFLEEFSRYPAPFRDKVAIAMLTSSLNEMDKTRSFQFENVVDFISKPLNETKIKELTQRLGIVR